MYIVVEPFFDVKDGKEYEFGDVYTGDTDPERLQELMGDNTYKEIFVEEKIDEYGNAEITEE